MDQLQPFINKYNGQQGVGNTPENKGQCVGLIEVWFIDTLKLPQIWGDAQDLMANADKNYYNVISNTPTGIPPRGSVLTFSKQFNGTVGHTGIVTKADVNTFELFEQNNPLGAGCRLHTYSNYNFVQGWIVPKVSEPMATITQKELDAIIAARNSNWELYQNTLKKLTEAQNLLTPLTDKVNKIKAIVS